ncbi:hypothetical protein, partial [Klebsiella pneumoniae]|uniref:hypothetical protein n=1 Tax=Klebsiella pneumoniae TaxID=573 RepID=UPI002FF2E267
QNDVTLKMPAFEWVHVQLHQQKGMISLSPPTICNSAQEEINFHYKPLWQPEFDLYDKGRTVIQMKDWYVLKDPRQFYYGAYTQTRAKQQEILESNFTLVEKHDLLRNISEEILNKVTKLLLPLYCKQDIFIFYIQWLIFLLIGNTMKNTMLRKGLTIF